MFSAFMLRFLSFFQNFFSYLGALKGIYDRQFDRLEEAENRRVSRAAKDEFGPSRSTLKSGSG